MLKIISVHCCYDLRYRNNQIQKIEKFLPPSPSLSKFYYLKNGKKLFETKKREYFLKTISLILLKIYYIFPC